MNQPQLNPLQRELAKGKSTEPHLDEDVLTAFAEHALPERERGQVVDHLALCAECREVLSFAITAAPEVATPAKPNTLPVRAPLRSWLPWLAVAAGVIVVSSTVAIHERTARMRTQAEDAAVTMAMATTTPPPLPQPAPHHQPEAVVPEQAARQNQQREAAIPQIQAPEIKKSASPAPAEPGVMEQQTYANLPLTTANRAAEPAAQTPSAAPSTSTVDALNAPAPPPPAAQDEAIHGAMAAKAKSAPAASTSAGGAREFGGLLGGSAALARSTIRPQWRINAQGQAERSMGYGPWQPVLTEEKARMRVISVSGDEVWLGGESLRLYHSDDSGATWHMVSLPAKGNGDRVITHIHFQSGESGVVQTGDGTEWDTVDGGKTWK